jgi:hypothetical protein
MRFREDKPADLDRARAAVTAWREQNPAGTEDQLTAALGPQFHPDYGPVLRAVLFTHDRSAPAPSQEPPGPQACEDGTQQASHRNAVPGTAFRPCQQPPSPPAPSHGRQHPA